jgi:hypothetical protein
LSRGARTVKIEPSALLPSVVSRFATRVDNISSPNHRSNCETGVNAGMYIW